MQGLDKRGCNVIYLGMYCHFTDQSYFETSNNYLIMVEQ